MSITLPYHIIHMQLADQFSYDKLNASQIERVQYYIVFWWHEIALGQLYIEDINRDGTQLNILEAILPALIKYALDKEIISKVIASFEQQDFLSFNSILDQILKNYRSNNLPNNVSISIVVCTRNRSESLKKCLDKIINQLPAPGEIIVIDNAPTDDSTKEVVKLYANVIYFKEPRAGLDIARNTGAYLAKFPIVAYTDDDVCVDKLWAYRIWETFLDESVNAMTGLVIANELETESQQIFEKYWGFNKGYQDIYFNSDFINCDVFAPKVWDIGAGANMAFRKSAIQAVNYFDDRLDVGAAGCSGDSEIWFKMLSKGLIIHYNPRAIVFHDHRRELKQLHKQLFGYMRGHVAAALIQHSQNRRSGYRKYIFRMMPRYYLLLLKLGFPYYEFRYQTLWSEISGLISGVVFFYKHKSTSSYTCDILKK